jgi:hypothetical protein
LDLVWMAIRPSMGRPRCRNLLGYRTENNTLFMAVNASGIVPANSRVGQ